MLLRFLHGGDFHLDSPFLSLSPTQAAKARGEQRELLDRFSLLAREEGADLVFLTGDLFDGRRVYPETLRAFRRMLEEIPAEIFIAPGNHDPYTDDSPYARLTWPHHVHIFRSHRVTAIPLPHLGCTVYGSAFTGSHRGDSPLAGHSPTLGGGLHFGCFHGEVGTAPSPYGSIAPKEIEASGFHYLALGHVHSASGLQKAGRTYWAYPGCPQGRGFDELGEKGVLLGTTDGRTLGLSFQPLYLRQYRELTVPLKAGEAEVSALRRVLPSTPSPDIVRIAFTGERDGEGALPTEALLKLAAPYFYQVTLEDRTHPSRDLWARREEEGLTGLFLRNLHHRMVGAGPEEREKLELALRFGLGALEGGEEPL